MAVRMIMSHQGDKLLNEGKREEGRSALDCSLVAATSFELAELSAKQSLHAISFRTQVSNFTPTYPMLAHSLK